MARFQVSAAGTQPVMMEWSVSPEETTPGQGMMEPVWRDVMHGHLAIFTTASSHVKGKKTLKLCKVPAIDITVYNC